MKVLLRQSLSIEKALHTEILSKFCLSIGHFDQNVVSVLTNVSNPNEMFLQREALKSPTTNALAGKSARARPSTKKKIVARGKNCEGSEKLPFNRQWRRICRLKKMNFMGDFCGLV